MQLFKEWVCETLLQITSDPLSSFAEQLVDRIDSQPKVTVHRDYHSRNLMLTSSNELGIVDFQDALVGPLVYDLASLLYDCYYEFSTEEIARYLEQYQMLANKADIPKFSGLETLQPAVMAVAVQRQLKAVGIFTRLWFLQNKNSHLPHVLPVTTRISKLASMLGFDDLASWLEHDVIPALPERLESLN